MKFYAINGILIFFIILRATSDDEADNATSEKTSALPYSERGTTQLCEIDYLFMRSLIATLEQIQVVTNATSKTWATLFTTYAITKPKSNKTTLRSNKKLTKMFRTRIYDRFDMHRKRRRRSIDFSELTSAEKEAIGFNDTDTYGLTLPGENLGNHDVGVPEIKLSEERNSTSLSGTLSKDKTLLEKGKPPHEAAEVYDQHLLTTSQQRPTTQNLEHSQSNLNEEHELVSNISSSITDEGKVDEIWTESFHIDEGQIINKIAPEQTKIPCNETDTHFKVLKKVWIKQPCGNWKDIWTDMPLPLSPEHAKWFIKQHNEAQDELKSTHPEISSTLPLKAVQTWFKKEFVKNDGSKTGEHPGVGWTKIWMKQPDGKWKTGWREIAPTQAMMGQMPNEGVSSSWTKVWIKQPDGKWKTGWKKIVPTQSYEKKPWNKQSADEGGSAHWTKVWIKQTDGKWQTKWKKITPAQSEGQQTWNRPQFHAKNEVKQKENQGSSWTKVWMRQPDGKWKTEWKKVEPQLPNEQPKWTKKQFSGWNNDKKPDEGENPGWTKVWMKQPDGKWQTKWKKVTSAQSGGLQGWNRPQFSANNEVNSEGSLSPSLTKVWIKQPDGKWKTGWKKVVPTQSFEQQKWTKQPFFANNEVKQDVDAKPQWTKTWIKQPDGKWKTGWKQVVPTQSFEKQKWTKQPFSANYEAKQDVDAKPQWTKTWIKLPDGKWKTGWKQVVPTQSFEKRIRNGPQFSENEVKPKKEPNSNFYPVWTQYPDGKWGTTLKRYDSMTNTRSNQMNPIQDFIKRFSMPTPETSVLDWSQMLNFRSNRTTTNYFPSLTPVDSSMASYLFYRYVVVWVAKCNV